MQSLKFLTWIGLSIMVLVRPTASARAQAGADSAIRNRPLLLVPDAVWDGTTDSPRAGWVVLVRGSTIDTLGPAANITPPANAQRMELPGTTLIPGLIEGHSHLFLHPYNEASWDDQVLREPVGQRMARA